MPLWANLNQPAIALANQKIQGQSIRVDENRFAAIRRRVLQATLKPSSCQIGLRCVRLFFAAQSCLQCCQQFGLCFKAPISSKGSESATSSKVKPDRFLIFKERED
jgi:hypothetical protein